MYFGALTERRWRCTERASNFRELNSGRWRIRSRRASKSICANLVEGFGRQAWSKAEFRRFLMMATGSADEMQVWTLYARDLGYIGTDLAERWPSEYREIARMLQGLSRGVSDI